MSSPGTSLIERTERQERYHQEIASGLRRANGARLLQRLNGKHLTMINMHVAGVSQGQIAEEMGMTQPAVSLVLTDPLAIALIKERFEFHNMELMALVPKAVGVLREQLKSEDGMVALSAADKVLRANGKYETRKDRNVATTAEDIVSELLKQTGRGETVSLSVTRSRNSTDFQGDTLDHETL